MTMRAKILSMSEYTTKTGDSIIVMATDKGNFSNFKSIWLKQNIDEEKLAAGDELEITYTEYTSPKNGNVFKNFVAVRKA